MSLRILKVFALAVILAGCKLPPPEPDRPTTELTLQYSPNANGPEMPCGWVYAFDRNKGDPNLCVYVWPNGTWTLSAETPSARGAFTVEIANGSIDHGKAVGFPSGLIEDAQNLYIAGHISAALNGATIRTQSESQAR